MSWLCGGRYALQKAVQYSSISTVEIEIQYWYSSSSVYCSSSVAVVDEVL